jgi:predicted  nucleic acid-binding Zn-ribbon protein
MEEEINKLKEEVAKKEKEIEGLKERLKEKDKQLRFSLETWLYFMHGIESDIHHANPRIHAMMNEIGKE